MGAESTAASVGAEPRCVAIVGLDTFVGRGLADGLLEGGDGPRIVGLDLRCPPELEGRLRFHGLDLGERDAGRRLAQVLEGEGVDAVALLGFRDRSRPKHAGDSELAALVGTRVLNACAVAGVGRIVVESSTMCYGARPDNPNFLGEAAPLRGHPDSRRVESRVEVERLLAEWSRHHPDREITVLRHCWVMGPSYRDGVSRYLSRNVVPTVMGYDPLLQLIHEEDLLDVFQQATLEAHPGIFNVVGRGVVPLSTLLALAGRRGLPLPTPLLYRLGTLSALDERADRPAGFFDYLRYLWVADGERGWQEFGTPVYSTREAWSAFNAARMGQDRR